MSQPPAGTVTFLFTDIEGSTKLWQKHSEAMPAALRRHHALLSEAIAAHGGYVFQIIGDAFCAAFSTANDGLDAALWAQHALATESWGEIGAIRVRMALHTGRAEIQLGDHTSGEYASGLTLSRAARLLSAGHGGQILLSLATAELVRDHVPEDVALRDLGPRRLKDLIRPEQIFQVVAPGLLVNFAPLKTLDIYPHNLPVQLTSFIGREQEMGEIRRLLAGTHLLTLTGIGGTGKTRLALQISADLIDEFPNGIWLVELAPLVDPALVPQAVAFALDLRAGSDRPLIELLVNYLQEKHLLLILDNCEHVADACAQLSAKLLQAAPQLQILATSRVPLNMVGEMLYPVLPLTLPESGRVVPALALSQYEAVRLFIERARAVQPTFDVTNANAPAVAQICQQLDGIPLAIEFAAARMRLLSPDEIAARLGDRFNLLTAGRRTSLPRHQTLRAALDWSYDLLSKAERILFNRLAVFAGTFAFEAVEAVCADESDGSAQTGAICPMQVLDLLAALVDHSLVSLETRGTETRYVLLETIRQYALEKLEAAGERQSQQDRHLAYYLALAEQGEWHTRVGHLAWLDRFDVEYDNFRVAMAVALARKPESAIMLARALEAFAVYSPRLFEANDWAMQILALTDAWPPGRMRVIALWLAGDLAWSAGDQRRAKELMEAGLSMASGLDRTLQLQQLLCDLALSLAVVHGSMGELEQMKRYADQTIAMSLDLDDKYFVAGALWLLGHWALQSGDFKSSHVDLEHCLAISRQEDLPFLAAMALYSLTGLEHWEGNLARARKYAGECMNTWRPMKYQRGLVTVLAFLGRILVQEGDTLQARMQFEEGLAIAREMKLAAETAACLMGLVAVAGMHGQDQSVALLFGAFEPMFELHDDWTMSDLSHFVYDPIIAIVRERLGEAAFNAACANGRQMTLEEALEYAQVSFRL